MQAPAHLVHHLIDDLAKFIFRPDLIWPILAIPIGITVRQVRKLRRQAKKRTAARAVRGWLTLPAVIDVVSVSEHLDSDGKKYYLAALTYFYRHPNLEMGEYQREFPLKASAQNWVKQFKGRQVTIHVNPKDVTESFVLESDLEGLETRQIPATETPVQLDSIPALSSVSRFYSALGEQIGIAGLAASAILLVVSLATGGGKKCPNWLLWTGGTMLAVAFLLMVAVQFQCRNNETAKNFLHSYKLWSPVWMQWALKATVIVFSFLWILNYVRADLPLAMQLWMKGLEPHLPYFVSCFGFLAISSFHAAVQRSQERIQLSASGA
jgi:hypothetical protein